LNPFSTKLAKSVEDPGLEALWNHAVGTLYLAVGLRVCNSYPIYTDVVFVAKLQKLLARKLGAVVGDDGVCYCRYFRPATYQGEYVR
jgi:uncharacterized membrane protein YdcZ (DUF606 family)